MILIDKQTYDPITMKAKAFTSIGKIKVKGTCVFGDLHFFNETKKEHIYNGEWRWINV